MSDPEQSTRSSVLTDLTESRPSTPTPQDSRSGRQSIMPPTPQAERIVRLPESNTAELLQTFMLQIETRLSQQQQALESRIESLLASKGKEVERSPTIVEPPITAPSSSRFQANANPFLDAPKADTEPIPPTSAPSTSVHSAANLSGIENKSPSFPQSYSPLPIATTATKSSSSTKVKASDLPKFFKGKTDDVEVWLEQLSAIFEANGCTNSEINALLSVILKGTALKWFTRLGPKGRSQFPTWSHWQEALRQRFLKANYLAEKKRLWKKRELRSNEEMADYFDAKVDLQAFVFDENTPDYELILDILDGLPELCCQL